MKDKSSPFNIERKGYNRFEVEQYIKKLESEKAQLELEVESLKGELSLLILKKAEWDNKKTVIQDTLINAELTAREIVARAEKRANDAEKMYQSEVERIDHYRAEKEHELEEILKRVEYILQSQLALIERNKSPQGGQNN